MTDQSTDAYSGNALPLCDYREYLHRVFGEETAEYFLNLDSPSQNFPVWYTQMKDSMSDQVSAEALLDAQRQRSAQILKEMETKPSQAKTLLTDWEGQRRQDHLQRLFAIRMMFRSAQINQAYTSFLLDKKPLSPLCNPETVERCSKYPSENSTKPKE